jgi:hypothetical protein
VSHRLATAAPWREAHERGSWRLADGGADEGGGVFVTFAKLRVVPIESGGGVTHDLRGHRGSKRTHEIPRRVEEVGRATRGAQDTVGEREEGTFL